MKRKQKFVPFDNTSSGNNSVNNSPTYSFISENTSELQSHIGSYSNARSRNNSIFGYDSQLDSHSHTNNDSFNNERSNSISNSDLIFGMHYPSKESIREAQLILNDIHIQHKDSSFPLEEKDNEFVNIDSSDYSSNVDEEYEDTSSSYDEIVIVKTTKIIEIKSVKGSKKRNKDIDLNSVASDISFFRNPNEVLAKDMKKSCVKCGKHCHHYKLISRKKIYYCKKCKVSYEETSRSQREHQLEANSLLQRKSKVSREHKNKDDKKKKNIKN